MSIRTVLLSASLLVLSLNSHAQTTIKHYIGGDLGFNMREQHFLLVNKDEYDGTTERIEDKLKFNMFSGSIYYGMAFNDKFAVEFTWTYPWSHTEERASSYSEDNYDPNYPGYKDKGIIAGHLFDVTALYRPLDNIPGFFIKGGVSHSSTQVTSKWVNDDDILGSPHLHNYVIHSEKYPKTSGIGMVFGIGYEHPIFENLRVRASYTYYQGLSSYFSANSNTFKVGLNYGF